MADFELLNKLFDHDAVYSKSVLPFAEDPPHPRLRDTGFHWFGEEWPLLVLCHRGRRLNGMDLFGEKLCLQLRTTDGFLVMVSTPSGSTGSYWISIYYILGGFRGGEWGMLHGREKETPLAWTMRVVFKRWPASDFSTPRGPEPLQDWHVEDERNLAFKVYRQGWYRLTLFERNPRRSLLSTWRFEHVNSYWQQRRYFCVRKIWGRYEGDRATSPDGSSTHNAA